MGKLCILILFLSCFSVGHCQTYDDKVLVVVAKWDIEPYDCVIDSRMVERIKYPESLLPRYAPLDEKDVLGKIATEFIGKGEIISLQRLIDGEEYKDSLTFDVPPGWHHTTLPIRMPKDVGGLKVDREVVDIVALYKDKDGWVSRIAATGARLIKVGKPLDRDGYNPFFFALSKEDADLIGFLRTQPTIDFHLLVKDKWLSEPTKVEPVRDSEI